MAGGAIYIIYNESGENRILFNKMLLSECLSDEQYAKAVNSKGENYSTELYL
jgi:hypothetical protein